MIKRLLSIVFVMIFVASAFGQTTGDAAAENRTADKPIIYGLVIDNSGSFRTIFEDVIQTASQIAEANSSDDEAFLVRFVDADKINLVQDFTSSIDELQSAAEEMFIEGGQTAVLDAVYFSAQHLAAKKNPSGGQKSLILITDGEDRKSATKIENLLKFLKHENIRVFTLGLSDGKIYKGLLDKLAKETGGKSFIVEKRPELKNIVKELTVAVRAQ